MSVLRKPEVCFRTALLMALGLLSSAAALAVECTLEQGSMIRRMDVPAGETSLAGQWATLGVFRVRTALTTPRQGRAWLLIEVYAEALRALATDAPLEALLRRFETTDEIAALVAFIASPLSSATNGAALRADGEHQNQIEGDPVLVQRDIPVRSLADHQLAHRPPAGIAHRSADLRVPCQDSEGLEDLVHAPEWIVRVMRAQVIDDPVQVRPDRIADLDPRHRRQAGVRDLRAAGRAALRPRARSW